MRIRLRAGPTLAAVTLVFAGCGGVSVPGVAKQAAVAACEQAATAIKDAQARGVADQACKAGATGDVRKASAGAKQAAREGCLGEARKVVDPVARQQVAALGPTAR